MAKTTERNYISQQQKNIRSKNHIPSAVSKGKSGTQAKPAQVDIGSLVYIKKEGDKSKARESYIVMGIKDHLGILQILNASGNFMSRSYELPLTELIPAVKDQVAPE